MGTVKVTIGVGDLQGRLFEDLEVTVDTGSTYTAVPRELLQRLGVPVQRSAPLGNCRRPDRFRSTLPTPP